MGEPKFNVGDLVVIVELFPSDHGRGGELRSDEELYDSFIIENVAYKPLSYNGDYPPHYFYGAGGVRYEYDEGALALIMTEKEYNLTYTPGDRVIFIRGEHIRETGRVIRTDLLSLFIAMDNAGFTACAPKTDIRPLDMVPDCPRCGEKAIYGFGGRWACDCGLPEDN